jgi:hypothetical protein
VDSVEVEKGKEYIGNQNLKTADNLIKPAAKSNGVTSQKVLFFGIWVACRYTYSMFHRH